MASETYRRVGRGGAGNFLAAQDMAGAAKDLEAQDASSAEAGFLPVERPAPEYLSRGRGGAGNISATADLPEKEPSNGVVIPPSPATRAAYSGRGGAGNYVPPDESAARAEESKLTEDARRMEEDVVRDVDASLRTPEQAYLGGRETV